jgi:hypothetical protein
LLLSLTAATGRWKVRCPLRNGLGKVAQRDLDNQRRAIARLMLMRPGHDMKRLQLAVIAIGVLASLHALAAAQPDRIPDNPPPFRVAQNTCVQQCQQRNRDRVQICQIAFQQNNNLSQQRDCLAAAKSEFDNCMSTCR